MPEYIHRNVLLDFIEVVTRSVRAVLVESGCVRHEY
jgi:hypothetical protein